MSESADISAIIRSRIQARYPNAKIDVTGPTSALYVRVISEDFAPLSTLQREARIGQVVGEESARRIEMIDAYTSEEARVAPAPVNTVTAYLPFWTTEFALEENTTNDITYASDEDDDLAGPLRVTFYGLRGGVGRSTSLVATARLLAEKHDLRVLCIDMDLEAPALASLFGIEEELEDDLGVLAALSLLEYEDVDITRHIIPVDGSTRLLCMPAGLLSQAYIERLSLIDVEYWYRDERNPLRRLFELVEESNLDVDAILIDSRTGLSPIAGPLLFDVNDLAVVFFQPQSQARQGTELLVRRMLTSKVMRRSGKAHTPEPRFVVGPMPPGPSAEEYTNRAASWVSAWLAPATAKRQGVANLEPADAMHVVSYEAGTAFSDRVTGNLSNLAPYAKIAQWIIQLVPSRDDTTTESVASAKERVLADLNLHASTAEAQDSLLDVFVITGQVAQALNDRVPLIVGRKGTGKTALFRYLAEAGSLGHSIVATAPNQYQNRPTWSLSADGYAAIHGAMEDPSEWRVFWLAYMVRVIGREFRSIVADLSLDSELRALCDGETQLDVVSNFRNAIKVPLAALKLEDWLHRAASSVDRRVLVLFDGLDTAFGHTRREADRRNEALSALLSLQAEIQDRIRPFYLKVFVRTDIYEDLSFQNKSHFLGALRLQLRWADEADLYRVLLRHALRSEAFRDLVKGSMAVVDYDVARWSTELVQECWSLLVAERMRGEQTAFTWNWVWNRLADGNFDHSPRTLIQLFAEALRLERLEKDRSPYDRSIIRPRLLVPSLTTVSHNALDALVHEEFQELEDFAEQLRQHGKTPILVDEIEADSDLLELAVESGLIQLREDVTSRLIRVPDLYRHALGVTRPGPA